MPIQTTNKKVLVTGGAGFIGSHTVDEFLSAGYKVTVLDNLRTGDLKNLEHITDSEHSQRNQFTFVEGDIRNAELVASLIDNETSIVHLAALISVPESIENPELAHDINVNGTHNLLLKAKEKNAPRFVSASSAAIYGLHAPVPTPESVKHDPLSPYGIHKSINEQYGKLYAELYGLQCVFLRFFNVYGPRQKAEGGYPSVIPAFIKKVLAGEPAKINGSGSISRDFIFVKDIARALRLAVEVPIENLADKDSGHKENFTAINIAGGTPTTLDTLWNTMCEIKGVQLKPIYGEKRVGDIEVSIADVKKAKEKLGFETQVGLKEGLESLFSN